MRFICSLVFIVNATGSSSALYFISPIPKIIRRNFGPSEDLQIPAVLKFSPITTRSTE